jgi:transcriptional regulator with XRE-family HTH domain
MGISTSTVNVDKIRQLCAANSITLCELERNTGIGNGIIARWNSSDPRVGSLTKVANYFGVKVDNLLNRDDTNDV